jgi:hypothetical protein
MRTIVRAARYALCVSAAGASLAACAALQPAPNLPLPQQQSAIGRSNGGKTSDLLYVGHKNTVQTFSYPSGSAQGTFKVRGSVNGMCSDASGNVFVTAITEGGAGYVYEYKHGGASPISTLNLPKHEIPEACSSDPTTTKLAVTMYSAENYAASVAIYAKASGSPTIYKSREIGANPQGAYDNKGNLFVTSSGNVGAELPAGKTGLVDVTFSKTLGLTSHVQWDGDAFALQSFRVLGHQRERLLEQVFRLQISGSSGKIVGSSTFVDWKVKEAGQSWIEDGTVVATPLSEIAFWKYPAGGKAFKIIHPSDPAKAVTISVAP